MSLCASMRKKEREWEIIRLRARGEYLGTVSARNVVS
jgi:hypothetical protein